MKKMLMILILTIGVAFAANAQPRAVGIKAGWGAEAMYQHSLNEDFVEVDLGLYTFTAVNAASTYNFMIAQPKWTNKGEWGFYAGPGLSVGYIWAGNSSTFDVAVAGQVGLEYTFWFPLRLSFDIRPQLGAAFGHGASAFYWGIGPMVSASYRF